VNGWISLHRRIQSHWLYSERRVFSKLEAWIDILLQVNHSEARVMIKGEVLECGVGESLNSMVTWSKRWGWSDSKVKRFLKNLEKDEMVLVKSSGKTTRLSVVNYGDFQDKATSEQRANDEDSTSKRRGPDEKSSTNNKNNKNNKNYNEDNVINKPPAKSGGLTPAEKGSQTKAFNLEFEEKVWPWLQNFPNNKNFVPAQTKWAQLRRHDYEAKQITEYYKAEFIDGKEFVTQFFKACTEGNLKQYYKAKKADRVELPKDLTEAEIKRVKILRDDGRYSEKEILEKLLDRRGA